MAYTNYNTLYAGSGENVVRFAANQDGFNPVFRVTIDFAKTPAAASTNYMLLKLPTGFVPRIASVNVVKALATTAGGSSTTRNFTVNIGSDSDVDSLASSGTMAAYQAGSVVVASLVKGTAASSSANATTLNPAVVPGGTTPYYISFSLGTATADGVATITVAGDQMVEPSQVL